jgi:FdrA protein
MIQHLEVRRGEYHDSVTLMLAARAVGAVPGVASALVAMGTELNLELLAGMGFTLGEPAGINDLIVAFSHGGADGEGGDSAAETALAALASALTTKPESGAGSADDAAPAPRTVSSALRRTGGSLALISTPGPSAAVECMDALEEGASAIVFSDNVPLTHEIRLKEEAARRGLLVMGPDCGTVVLDGVGYGFANVTRPGPISLVAASGTGAQQVMSLLDAADIGTRHCLGVGGRDLTPAVAGRSTHAALDALDADPGTELIVVVAKPPDAAVAAQVREHARRLATPVVFALVGAGMADMTAAVGEVVRALGRTVPEWAVWVPSPGRPGLGVGGSSGAGGGWVGGGGGKERTAKPDRPAKPSRIVGLFSGGTLCAEARVIIADAGLDDASLTDFGDDAYTRGRPHPMIDHTLRLDALAAALDECDAGVGASVSTAPLDPDPADSQYPEPGPTTVLLLDVVLGRGAHPDPAAELAPAIAAATRRGLPVVVSLCGTVRDPQGLERQARLLADAGALVHLSNAAAARAAVQLTGSTLTGGPRP